MDTNQDNELDPGGMVGDSPTRGRERVELYGGHRSFVGPEPERV